MAWKFLSIGKANARVDELEAQLASVTAERDQLKTTLESNASELTAHAEDLSAKLADAENKLNDLAAKVATAEAAVAEAKAEIAAKDAEVDAKASAKALEIVASQGAAPVPIKAAEPTAQPEQTKLTGLAKTKAAFAQQLNRK